MTKKAEALAWHEIHDKFRDLESRIKTFSEFLEKDQQDIDTLMSRSEDLKRWIEVNESRVHGLISLVSLLVSKIPEGEIDDKAKQLMMILAVDSFNQLKSEGVVPEAEQTSLDS